MVSLLSFTWIVWMSALSRCCSISYSELLIFTFFFTCTLYAAETDLNLLCHWTTAHYKNASIPVDKIWCDWVCWTETEVIKYVKTWNMCLGWIKILIYQFYIITTASVYLSWCTQVRLKYSSWIESFVFFVIDIVSLFFPLFLQVPQSS